MRAILFDADGVLFDATELHRVALNAALKFYGYAEISEADHASVFNGLPTSVKLGILASRGQMSADDANNIEIYKQKVTHQLVPSVIVPNNNLSAELARLRENYRLVVCSNARLATVQAMAAHSQIAEHFEIMLGNESVLRNKPHPDVYLLAGKQLGLPLRECVIVEDSPKGIVAAIQAGPGMLVRVLGVADTINQLKHL